jgi:hypothetical protein
MGSGLDQTTARRRAKFLHGIAVSARKGSTGRWVTGGWAGVTDVWIVLTLDGKVVLDDGESQSPDDLED